MAKGLTKEDKLMINALLLDAFWYHTGTKNESPDSIRKFYGEEAGRLRRKIKKVWGL